MTAKLAKHWLTMIIGTCVPILPVTWLRDGLVWVLSLTFMGFYFDEQWPSWYQCHEFFVIRHIIVHMICYLQWTSLAGFLWKGNSTNPQYRLTSRHLAQPPFPNLFSPFSLHLSLYTHKPVERQLFSKLTSPSLTERLHGSCPTPYPHPCLSSEANILLSHSWSMALHGQNQTLDNSPIDFVIIPCGCELCCSSSSIFTYQLWIILLLEAIKAVNRLDLTRPNV